MDTNNVELHLVNGFVAEVVDVYPRELNDLQLALVGGGIADPIAF